MILDNTIVWSVRDIVHRTSSNILVVLFFAPTFSGLCAIHIPACPRLCPVPTLPCLPMPEDCTSLCLLPPPWCVLQCNTVIPLALALICFNAVKSLSLTLIMCCSERAFIVSQAVVDLREMAAKEIALK